LRALQLTAKVHVSGDHQDPVGEIMSAEPNPTDPPAIKDEDNELPIPGAWRSTFRDVVHAFVEQDFGIAQGLPSVEPISADTADHIKAYLDDYGETLIELPEETWSTSIYLWHGTHWEALVDLWTAESGPSDMVLSARVFEAGEGYRFEVQMVYVP
jgi:hypothetical protein